MGLLSTASLEPDKHDLHASGSTGVGATCEVGGFANP